MADTIFDANDRVDGVELPAELVTKIKGMTPAQQSKEIINFYQGRERGIAEAAFDRGRQSAPPASTDTPPAQPHKPTAQDVWNRPVEAIEEVVDLRTKDTVKRSEFDSLTASAMPALVEAAYITLREKYKTARVPFSEVEADVRAEMAKMPGNLQINPVYIEAAYDAIKGRKMDHYISQAETRAKAPPSERVVNPGQPAPTPRELNEGERKVIEGLGRTPERYRKAQEAMEAGGALPYTLDNRNR